MLSILAPVDGSNNASRMVGELILLAKQARQLEVYVINVREPIDAAEIRKYWSEDKIAEFQQAEGRLLLESVAKRLADAGIKHTTEVVVGDIAPTIAAQAKSKGCNLIMMGTRGLSGIANLFMGSVATKVIHLADVPVQLVK